VYLVSRGLKSIARVNVITFFLACIILSSAVIAFFQGTINNVKPVFGSGINSIFSGVMTTVFSYAAMEILVIIHPYVKNKKKILKAGLISTIVVMIFYTWSVFACTIYLGTDIVPKIFWPFAFVSESVKIPIVNNFRFIWMLLWPIFVFRTIATEYYMSAEIMNHIFNLGVKRWCVILSPIIFIFPLLFENESARRNFYGDITKWVTIFNLLYVTVIAILVRIKRNEFSNI
jgi:Spore germination protein.